MKKLALLSAFALCTTIAFGQDVDHRRENVRKETMEHPRINKAIHDLEDAIAYMEKAPHDFNGNKAQAIADSRRALASLRQAMLYRAKVDNKDRK